MKITPKIPKPSWANSGPGCDHYTFRVVRVGDQRQGVCSKCGAKGPLRDKPGKAAYAYDRAATEHRLVLKGQKDA